MIKPGVLHTSHEVGHHTEEVGTHGAEAVHGAPEMAGHAAEHVSNFVSGFTFPGLLELGTMIGFLGLFGFVILNVLSKTNLTAKSDPYLEESLHHHV